MRPARWLIPELDSNQVETVARDLRIAPLVARILVRRGYGDSDSANAFLRPTLANLLDPYSMRGMRDAAGRLREAIARGEHILLYGDYDVDGTSSIVILKKALELAGASADFHVPHRLRDGYGMRPEVIREAAERGTKLIVSVDTGIRANEVVRLAGELGIDVIVTDHHLPESELPPAFAVLNPNQPGCEYRNKELCGAGVAFKLVQALLRELGMPEARQTKLAESFLKLVAIATVADVVPLTGENRVIVKHGLDGLERTPNHGLRELLNVAGLAGARPTAGQVAFRVAPRINAAGRMASARDVIEMFLTQDPERAKQLASQLHDLNTDRQQTEADIVAAALEDTVANPVTDERRGLVFSGVGWHRGVVGIVASRMVERFHRPVFVLGIDEEKGEAVGSGRSVRGFHLLDALESMPELFVKFGGHKQAAGVTLPIANLSEFNRRFNEYACERIPADELRAQHEIDAVVSVPELHEESVSHLMALSPFGFGNPAPLLAVLDAQVGGVPEIMKEKHLKLRVGQQGRWLTCKGWNWAERAEQVRGPRLDVAVTVEDDAYWGWSATLKDARPANS
ncbi:MAG: single-stranded-DNA-specific exonuclease RecJ [Bryobacteraceae bacterium]